jgi:hypothetical protein
MKHIAIFILLCSLTFTGCQPQVRVTNQFEDPNSVLINELLQEEDLSGFGFVIEKIWYKQVYETPNDDNNPLESAGGLFLGHLGKDKDESVLVSHTLLRYQTTISWDIFVDEKHEHYVTFAPNGADSFPDTKKSCSLVGEKLDCTYITQFDKIYSLLSFNSGPKALDENKMDDFAIKIIRIIKDNLQVVAR